MNDFGFAAHGSMPTTMSLHEDWSKHANDGGFRLEWFASAGKRVQACWRLERVASGRNAIFPDLDHAYVSPRPGEARPHVIIGEEASGETSFRAWLQRPGKCTGKATPGATKVVDLGDFSGEEPEALFRFVMSRLAAPGAADSGNDLIAALTEFAKRPPVYLSRLDHIDRRLGGLLLGRIRGALESPEGERRMSGVSLLLMGRDERAFDIEPYSAIGPVAELCRLPRFTSDEVQCLLARHRGQDLKHVPPADAHRVQRMTGGQPLLTQQLLRRLPVRSQSTQTTDFEQIYRSLRDDSPPVLALWRKRLADMVLRNSGLHAVASDLAKGLEYPIDPDPVRNRSDGAPGYAYSLSLAGWLSPSPARNGDGLVWRFSDLHQAWAKAVLRDPKSFQQIDGRRS